MKQGYGKKYARIFLNVWIPILGTVAVLWGAVFLWRWFAPFVVGWLLAQLANPMVHFFEKHFKIIRSQGSVLVIVGVLALLILGGYALGSWIVQELIILGDHLPEYMELFQEMLQAAVTKLEGVIALLPERLQQGLDAFASDPAGYIAVWFSDLKLPIMDTATDIVQRIPHIFVFTIVMILSAYFFVSDHEKVQALLLRWLPQSVKDNSRHMMGRFRFMISGYFRAQFQILFVIFLALAVGLFILKVPFYGLWALGIAVLDFLPLFGTGFILWPWAALSLLWGDMYRAVGLLIIYAVTQVIRQLVQPKLMGDSLGLHPLLSLLFMYVGFRVAGFGGMLLACPIGLVVMEILKSGLYGGVIFHMRVLLQDIRDFRQGREVPVEMILRQENATKVSEEETEEQKTP